MNEILATEYERVESSYARQHLSELLDAVLTGKTFTITRHGRDIAQLVPVSAPAHAQDHSSAQGKLMDKIKRRDDHPRAVDGIHYDSADQ